MEFRKEGTRFVIRLEKGEKIIEGMNAFLSEKQVKGGALQGIGAVDEVELGYFLLEKKDYEWKRISGELEVVSLLGTVSEAGVHAHICVSDRNFNCFAGHLRDARVSVTMEMFLTEMKKIRRKEDPASGLKLLEL